MKEIATQADINQWEKENYMDIVKWQKDFSNNTIEYSLTNGTVVRFTMPETKIKQCTHCHWTGDETRLKELWVNNKENPDDEYFEYLVRQLVCPNCMMSEHLVDKKDNNEKVV